MLPDVHGVWWVGDYKTPLLRRAVTRFKYEGLRDLAPPLARLLWERLYEPTIRSRWQGTSSWALVPSPMNHWRRRARGLDHTQLLTQALSSLTDLPLVQPLHKQRRATQVSQSETDRRTNLQGAISVRDQALVTNRRLILIDDVITTGATASACAQELIQAGAQEVWVLALARG